MNSIYGAWQQCNLARNGSMDPKSLKAIVTEIHDNAISATPDISTIDLQKDIVTNFCSLLSSDISDAAIAASTQVGI